MTAYNQHSTFNLETEHGNVSKFEISDNETDFYLDLCDCCINSSQNSTAIEDPDSNYTKPSELDLLDSHKGSTIETGNINLSSTSQFLDMEIHKSLALKPPISDILTLDKSKCIELLPSPSVRIKGLCFNKRYGENGDMLSQANLKIYEKTKKKRRCKSLSERFTEVTEKTNQPTGSLSNQHHYSPSKRKTEKNDIYSNFSVSKIESPIEEDKKYLLNHKTLDDKQITMLIPKPVRRHSTKTSKTTFYEMSKINSAKRCQINKHFGSADKYLNQLDSDKYDNFQFQTGYDKDEKVSEPLLDYSGRIRLPTPPEDAIRLHQPHSFEKNKTIIAKRSSLNISKPRVRRNVSMMRPNNHYRQVRSASMVLHRQKSIRPITRKKTQIKTEHAGNKSGLFVRGEEQVQVMHEENGKQSQGQIGSNPIVGNVDITETQNDKEEIKESPETKDNNDDTVFLKNCMVKGGLADHLMNVYQQSKTNDTDIGASLNENDDCNFKEPLKSNVDDDDWEELGYMECSRRFETENLANCCHRSDEGTKAWRFNEGKKKHRKNQPHTKLLLFKKAPSCLNDLDWCCVYMMFGDFAGVPRYETLRKSYFNKLVKLTEKIEGNKNVEITNVSDGNCVSDPLRVETITAKGQKFSLSLFQETENLELNMESQSATFKNYQNCFNIETTDIQSFPLCFSYSKTEDPTHLWEHNRLNKITWFAKWVVDTIYCRNFKTDVGIKMKSGFRNEGEIQALFSERRKNNDYPGRRIVQKIIELTRKPTENSFECFKSDFIYNDASDYIDWNMIPSNDSGSFLASNDNPPIHNHQHLVYIPPSVFSGINCETTKGIRSAVAVDKMNARLNEYRALVLAQHIIFERHPDLAQEFIKLLEHLEDYRFSSKQEDEKRIIGDWIDNPLSDNAEILSFRGFNIGEYRQHKSPLQLFNLGNDSLLKRLDEKRMKSVISINFTVTSRLAKHMKKTFDKELVFEKRKNKKNSAKLFSSLYKREGMHFSNGKPRNGKDRSYDDLKSAKPLIDHSFSKSFRDETKNKEDEGAFEASDKTQGLYMMDANGQPIYCKVCKKPIKLESTTSSRPGYLSTETSFVANCSCSSEKSKSSLKNSCGLKDKHEAAHLMYINRGDKEQKHESKIRKFLNKISKKKKTQQDAHYNSRMNAQTTPLNSMFQQYSSSAAETVTDLGTNSTLCSTRIEEHFTKSFEEKNNRCMNIEGKLGSEATFCEIDGYAEKFIQEGLKRSKSNQSNIVVLTAFIFPIGISDKYQLFKRNRIEWISSNKSGEEKDVFNSLFKKLNTDKQNEKVLLCSKNVFTKRSETHIKETFDKYLYNYNIRSLLNGAFGFNVVLYCQYLDGRAKARMQLERYLNQVAFDKKGKSAGRFCYVWEPHSAIIKALLAHLAISQRFEPEASNRLESFSEGSSPDMNCEEHGLPSLKPNLESSLPNSEV